MAESSYRKRADFTGVIIGAILLPVLFLFISLGKEDMGRSVFVCLGAIGIAIRMRWSLRRHAWFWGIALLVFALNVPLFVVIRWPGGWLPAIGWMPLALADYFAVIGAVRFVQRFVLKSDRGDEV